MSLSIKKSGIIETEFFTEFIANAFDKTTYVEPDGSAWIRIVHHNAPKTSRFASSNTFASQVYLDADRWFNASLCNYLSGSWELMVKQMTTSGGTEVKYRWIQTVNPMTTGQFEATKAANVTKITTSGYTNASAYGGCYILNNNTYLCCNNGTSGNWFGAFGCWNVWNEGLPGYGGSAVTTGYMDLYLRIDNTKANLNTTSFGNGFIKSKEIIEI